MARFGETLIDQARIEQADLGKQLEALHDLARLAHLVTWGRRWAECNETESCGGVLKGDDELLDSLLWPLEQSLLTVLTSHREALARNVTPIRADGGA